MNQNPKNLRLSFAMGGGVSLGSFSGAALTEALKAFVLFGKNQNGEPYDNIILDSMSGASAGAISLAILLRALMDYESVLPQLLDKENYNLEEVKLDIVNRLKEAYGKEAEARIEEKKETLIALQVAQDLQKKLWVDLIDIQKLFGFDKEGKRIKPLKGESFGLLNHDVILDLTVNYLLKGVDKIKLENAKILDKDQILFACSLTNLIPTNLKERIGRPSDGGKHKTVPLAEASRNATTSHQHKELRVFDFNFRDAHQEDNWLKIAEKAGEGWQINDEEPWAIFAASCIACGAFPLAFEPVILERFKREFAYLGTNSLFSGKLSSFDSFNFPYIDGGTFNNEPVKEAFKLGYYLDINRRYKQKKEEDYERIVIFVDPIVNANDPVHNIEAYDPTTAKGKKEIRTLKQKSELVRSIPLISQLVSVLRNQGSVKEELKIDAFVENLKLKTALYNYMAKWNLPSIPDEPEVEVHMLKKLIDLVELTLSRDAIPPGTRRLDEYLLWHVKRTYAEGWLEDLKDEVNQLKLKDIDEIIVEIQKLIKTASGGISPEDAKAFYGFLSEKLQGKKPDGLIKAFLNMFVDIALNVDGKNDNVVRVSITPVAFDKSKRKNVIPISLPGDSLQAFEGFAILEARQYAFLYGKYCALNVLKREDFRAHHNDIFNKGNQESLPFIEPEKVFYSIDRLEDELESVFDRFKENFPKAVKKNLSVSVLNRLKELIKGGYVAVGLFVSLSYLFVREIFPALLHHLGYKNFFGRDLDIRDNREIRLRLKFANSHYFDKYRLISMEGQKSGKAKFIKDKKDSSLVLKVFLLRDGDGRFHFYQRRFAYRFLENPMRTLSVYRSPSVSSKLIIEKIQVKRDFSRKSQMINLPDLNKQPLIDKIDCLVNPELFFNGDKNEWTIRDHTLPLKKDILRRFYDRN